MISDKPKVSVIIPTHSRASLLERAVRSVLAQTFADLEVLIVDDASSDDTRDVVGSFRDCRIRYLRHETNRGVSCSRNTAIANAFGDYIAFLDDDDDWLPEKLERQVRLIESLDPNVGAICCGHYEIDSSSDRILAEIKPALRGPIFEQLLTRGFFNHTSTILVKAECFGNVGFFDTECRYGEDFDMWLRIARHYDFDFVAAPLVRLYFQPDGLTRNHLAIISGAEMHLSKYREFFEQYPCVHSQHLHRLGTYYCFAGDLRKGREIFRRAMALSPTSAKSYFSYALTLAGAAGFKGCYTAKDRIMDFFSSPPVIKAGTGG